MRVRVEAAASAGSEQGPTDGTREPASALDVEETGSTVRAELQRVSTLSELGSAKVLTRRASLNAHGLRNSRRDGDDPKLLARLIVVRAVSVVLYADLPNTLKFRLSTSFMSAGL